MTRSCWFRFTLGPSGYSRESPPGFASRPSSQTTESPFHAPFRAALFRSTALSSSSVRRGISSRIPATAPARARTISLTCRSARSPSSTGPRVPCSWSNRVATSGPPICGSRRLSQHLRICASLESCSTSPQKVQHLVMQQSIRAYEPPLIYRPLAKSRRGPAAGLFHNQAERRQVPRFGHPINRHLRGPLGHQHVLPEAAHRAAAPRRVRQSPQAHARFRVLAWSRAGDEHHGFSETFPARDVYSLPGAVRSFAAVRVPACPPRQRRSTHYPRHDFSVFFNPYKGAERRNSPRELLRAVDRINNHPRAPITGRLFRYLLVRFFSNEIHRQSARRDFLERHRLDRFIRQSHDGPVILPFGAKVPRTEVLHRDGICLFRDFLEQPPIFFAIAHLFS